MKKITKKQAAEAQKELDKLFEQYGITKHNLADHSHYPYTMNTKAGTLFIAPQMEAGEYSLTIFCVFDDVESAKKVIPASNTRLNRCSGKFNFHETTVPDLINQFTREINSIRER